MGSLKILDGDGVGRFIDVAGEGTEVSPYRAVQDVNIQDQTSPIILVPFHNTIVSTTLAAAVAIDDTVVSVADATGVVVGQYLTIYNVAGARWYQGRVVSISVNDITVDTPMDFAYQLGDNLHTGSTQLNVNGSVTPQKFTVRAPDPGIDMVGDITRVIFIIETLGDTAWSSFGDIAGGLTNGCVLRKTDGTYYNIANVKSNAEMAAIMFDLDRIDRTAPTGTYGLKGRFTFGGQNKIGVVVRLEAGEDLEIIIQDDLSSLEDFRVIAEGHVVVD